jgi:hypothetical protein
MLAPLLLITGLLLYFPVPESKQAVMENMNGNAEECEGSSRSPGEDVLLEVLCRAA